MPLSGKQTEDDIYCACLSKALCHIPTPVTVGFYAPFGSRVYMLLEKITKCMREESSRLEDTERTSFSEKTRKPEGLGFLQFLWYLLFYKPLITEKHLSRRNIQFIFVPFSAWQYAGSDRLWAGLVTTLCDRMRSHFGALPLGLYHVLGIAPKQASDFREKEWTLKRSFCIKLGLTILSLLIGLVFLLVSLTKKEETKESGSTLTVLGSTATLISGSGIAMTIFKVGKNVVISQKKKIEKMVNSQKFSTQMGFMSEVKKEVELITNLVLCMEIFQRQKIRVVLQITSLELCAPDKVVGVLDAMNTLLSDSRAPFISILVVDPSIIVACLENASSMKGMADNGYVFLNRTVTLPFSVPGLGTKAKLQLLKKAVKGTGDLIDWPCRNSTAQVTKTGITETMRLLRAEEEEDEENENITYSNPRRYIEEALHCLYNEKENLHEYIPDSIAQMRRIVNTIPVTIRLMMLNHILSETLNPKTVAAWVVLANQWPCRISWILQCMEDELQLGLKEDLGKCLLWDVFKDNSKELYSMKANFKNLLDLDGDPEIFKRFLLEDYPFTVQDAQSFLKCTVNLDQSIKNRMGLIRGISNLQKAWEEPEKKAYIEENVVR
ncbi:NTPase KAP family P-loop domain-containing protein 1 [Rhinatrema bivittatum]|uniref:NTPase KAP family P-loop domain-containing protein 1 n=1 Tax=Rhinatrema bivittatum TaxID=194408 RepID=UPI00112B9EBF|nr:NTPase KAP family P-loop domain-containing protein 1 [Rhinatrema bivittatum]XP_029427454.1 NTPase KAP family P-loop domain-containing protein 1 [Rhinatrema bivittatum]